MSLIFPDGKTCLFKGDEFLTGKSRGSSQLDKPARTILQAHDS
jgi:hypothetical protein